MGYSIVFWRKPHWKGGIISEGRMWYSGSNLNCASRKGLPGQTCSIQTGELCYCMLMTWVGAWKLCWEDQLMRGWWSPCHPNQFIISEQYFPSLWLTVMWARGLLHMKYRTQIGLLHWGVASAMQACKSCNSCNYHCIPRTACKCLCIASNAQRQ